MPETIGVDFNGLRLNMARDFNKLAEVLSEALEDEEDSCYISVDKYTREVIIDKFNQLQSDIWGLMCLFDEKQGYREIWKEIKLLKIGDEVQDD